MNNYEACDGEGLVPAELILAQIKGMQPPYIFGAIHPVQIGEVFRIAGHPFKVLRYATRKEFEDANDDPAPHNDGLVYFEVTTD